MKIIPPHQISNEILNLIKDSKEHLTLIASRIDIENWSSFKESIESALKRGVKINLYTKADINNDKSWEQVEKLGITPKLVRNLRANLYFNEKEGVVSSVNLQATANSNSIEFGVKYDAPDEVAELKKYVEDYLKPYVANDPISKEDVHLIKESFIDIVQQQLSEHFDRSINCRWNNGSIEFYANNQYYFNLDKTTNKIRIAGTISKLEYNNLNLFTELYKETDTTIELSQSIISSTLNTKLSNTYLDNLTTNEKRIAIGFVIYFVDTMRKFKQKCAQL